MSSYSVHNSTSQQRCFRPCFASLHWRQAVPDKTALRLTHRTDMQAGVARHLTALSLSFSDRLVRNLDTPGAVLMLFATDELRLSFALKWATGCLHPTKSSVPRPATVALCSACTHPATAQQTKSKACKLAAMTRHDLLDAFPEDKACMLSHSAQKLMLLSHGACRTILKYTTEHAAQGLA